MSKKNSINYQAILRRSRCINSVSESVDSERIYSILTETINESESIKDNTLSSYINKYTDSMSNTDNSTRYCDNPINIIESLNNIDISLGDNFTNEYINRILPYNKNLNTVSEYLAWHDNITNNQRNKIQEAVNIYNTVDRILTNHKKINKEYNIEQEAKRYNNIGLKLFVEKCADIVNNYDVKPYQKFNIVIEECCYILDKNNINYNRKKLVECALKYYMFNNTNDIDKLKRVVSESLLLTENESNEIVTMVGNPNDSEPKSMNLSKAVKWLSNNGINDLGQVYSIVDNSVKASDKLEIIGGIYPLIMYLYDIYKINPITLHVSDAQEDYKEYNDILNIVMSQFATLTREPDLRERDHCWFKEDINIMINNINKAVYDIRNANVVDTIKSNASFIAKIINPIITGLEYVKMFVYYKSNYDTIQTVNAQSESTELIQEFKLLKFNNLVKAAFNLNKFLKGKEKKLYNKILTKTNTVRTKIKDVLFGESVSDIVNDIYSYIGEDNKADIIVNRYEFMDEKTSIIEEFLNQVCNEYNQILSNNGYESIRSYYIMNPYMAEVHIKESTNIELTEEEKQLVESSNNVLLSYVDMIKDSKKNVKKFKQYANINFIGELLDFSGRNNFGIEEFDLVLEILSYLDIPKDTIKAFAEHFNEYRYNKFIDNVLNESYIKFTINEKYITESANNWKANINVSDEIKLEVYNILQQLLESIDTVEMVEEYKSYKDFEDDEEDEDEDDEEDDEDKKKSTQKSKINSNNSSDKNSNINKMPSTKGKGGKFKLNSIKLAMMGIKNKFREMNSKQQEMSKNLDNNVNGLVTGIKRSMTNDRREAIIKGAVVPSFSRCIKSAIALAALGIATNNVAIPAIAGIGALAVSKKLNQKEKMLLLDEIETELEVVDKELALADRNDQTNKYRELLRYKKELQRQYQRIRYNLRVGKDLLPSSNVSMPTNNRD